MQRYRFGPIFIKREIDEANDLVVAKTDSRSMLSYMNQTIFQLEYDCSKFSTYEDISLNLLEDRMMNHLYCLKEHRHRFTTAKDYFKTIIQE